MKYNPKVNEAAARLPGFAGAHPATPEHLSQGALALMHGLQEALAEISGFPAITLQPAAGAHGELAGMLMVRAYHEAQGDSPEEGADSRHRPRHQPGLGRPRRLRGRAARLRRHPLGPDGRRGDG